MKNMTCVLKDVCLVQKIIIPFKNCKVDWSHCQQSRRLGFKHILSRGHEASSCVVELI